MPERSTTPVSLVLPLRIERLEEAIKVVDANGKAAAYFRYYAATSPKSVEVSQMRRSALPIVAIRSSDRDAHIVTVNQGANFRYCQPCVAFSRKRWKTPQSIGKTHTFLGDKCSFIGYVHVLFLSTTP